jgi:HlyD family secretion protein
VVKSPKKPMRLSFLLYSTTLFSIAILSSSCNSEETTKPVKKSLTEAVYASGFLVAENEYNVYALSDGYIVEKLKKSGDLVAKGETILRIQSDVPAAKMEAALAAAKIAQQNIGNNSTILKELKLKMSNAAAKRSNDSTNFVRYKNMFNAGAATKTQFDQATLTYESADRDYFALKEQYTKAVDQTQLDYKNAQSNVAAAGFDLSNYVIKSVMNGRVFELKKELGELVRKTDIVAVVGDAEKKLIQLNVDQSDISKIALGQKVIVKMDISANKTYTAKITKIYPAMNKSDQSFLVEAEFTDGIWFDFIHVSVEANIIIEEKQNVLVIPKTTLIGENEVEVKQLTGNKKITFKKGLENLEYVEVLEGLSETDEVIIPKN